MAGAGRLPARFPVGTHYVVEGVPGQDGELLITSRYVVLPNGTKVALPATAPRAVALGARRRRSNGKRAARG
jgi:hypothetical protein